MVFVQTRCADAPAVPETAPETLPEPAREAPPVTPFEKPDPGKCPGRLPEPDPDTGFEVCSLPSGFRGGRGELATISRPDTPKLDPKLLYSF